MSPEESAPRDEVHSPTVRSETSLDELARGLARHVAAHSHPCVPDVHLVTGTPRPQLLVVNGSRLYDLSTSTSNRVEAALAHGDREEIQRILTQLGLDAPAAIDDQPLVSPPMHALSLAVAQKCNLGCTYCYAQQGDFGGPAKNMSFETASRAVDLLLDSCTPGGKVNLAFLGGEPMVNRPVLRQVTQYASQQALDRGIDMRFSITTNGTLLNEDDAEFFETHGFAVTISLDGARDDHDKLRPFKNGSGSFDRIVARIAPLLQIQKRMQVSARVTVTPLNMDLPRTLQQFIDMGFHSVGFSPLLRSPNGLNQMDGEHLTQLLEGMIGCGLQFEQQVLKGNRYPFLNMVNALRELHGGTHRPYPCGAGAGYFGVSADGELAACHRFVDDDAGVLGNLETGVNREQQNSWLAARHVHFQEPCSGCWARYLCGGGCHHEVLARGRTACDFIRGWLHYTLQAYGRLSRMAPAWFEGSGEPAAADPVDSAKQSVIKDETFVTV